LFAPEAGRRRAKLADFALLPTLQRVLATAGTAMGNDADALAFAAPEQAGNPQLLSQAADMWSLGAVFHLLLTGHPPPTAGEKGASGSRPLRGHGGSIRNYYRVVPRGLDGLLDLIDRALATSPEARFRNAIEMQEQFQRIPPPPAVRVEFP
jgi:serine/threonine protein kinase